MSASRSRPQVRAESGQFSSRNDPSGEIRPSIDRRGRPLGAPATPPAHPQSVREKKRWLHNVYGRAGAGSPGRLPGASRRRCSSYLAAGPRRPSVRIKVELGPGSQIENRDAAAGPRRPCAAKAFFAETAVLQSRWNRFAGMPRRDFAMVRVIQLGIASLM